MIIAHELKLDVIKNNTVIVQIPQYNRHTHKLIITMAENGQLITLPTSGFTPYLKVLEDGGKILIEEECEIEDNAVTVILPNNVVCVPGRHPAQVDLINAETHEQVSTLPFYIKVPNSVYSEDAIINSDSFDQLNELIDEANNSIQTINEAADEQLADIQEEADEVINAARTAVNSNLRNGLADGSLRGIYANESGLAHYCTRVGEYTSYTTETMNLSNLMSQDLYNKVVKVEMGSNSSGISLDYENDSRIFGECEFSVNNNILTFQYPAGENPDPHSGWTRSKVYVWITINDDTAGKYSVALGFKTKASGECAFTEGFNARAFGDGSHAEGGTVYESIVKGIYITGQSGQMGYGGYTLTDADSEPVYLADNIYVGARMRLLDENNNFQPAESYEKIIDISSDRQKIYTNSTQSYDHKAIQIESSVESKTIASGDASHAEGFYTSATGFASHAEGSVYTIEDGDYSYYEVFSYSLTAVPNSPNTYLSSKAFSDQIQPNYIISYEEYNSIITSYIVDISNDRLTIVTADDLGDLYRKKCVIRCGSLAYGRGSHSEGSSMAIGDYSHAEGVSTSSAGYGSHAEGVDSLASGEVSHAEGYGTRAYGDYSHAEGSNTTASGRASHAEGNGATASGSYSHAEGNSTATNRWSHAEGEFSTASGPDAHAEGAVSVASGRASHAQNMETIAASEAQTALGKYNIEDANDVYAVIIGNGTTDNARSNALTVDWNGNVTTGGRIYSSDFKYDESALSVNSSYVSDGTLTVARRSNMVSIFGAGIKTSQAADGNINLLASALPSQYRPIHEVYSTDSIGNLYLKITVGGNLSFVNSTQAQTSGFYFSATYIAAD